MNVRYVLEGSVQRGGNRMRVNVQLIDAETGNHLWAERFDKPLADLFDMQDEIVARLAGALNAQLVAAEARRAEQAPNPDSMDLYFQGLAWFNKGITRDNLAQAQSFFDRALTADPGNVDALIGSARADAAEGANFFVTGPMAAFTAAEAKLAKALSSVPDHALGHLYLGFVDIMTKRAAEGIAECEHVLELDRNLAAAHASIGLGKVFIGRAEETEAHIVEALRLSPRDTMAYAWMTQAGIAKNLLGLWEQAVAWFRRAIEANRNYPHQYFAMSAALAQLGRLDEARSAINAGLALNPTFAVSRFRANLAARCEDQRFLAQLEPILEGMRKAGLSLREPRPSREEPPRFSWRGSAESNSAPTKCSGWRARQPSQDAALGTQGKTVPAVSDAKSVIGKSLGESKRRVDRPPVRLAARLAGCRYGSALTSRTIVPSWLLTTQRVAFPKWKVRFRMTDFASSIACSSDAEPSVITTPPMRLPS